jgi:hypothetical protein
MPILLTLFPQRVGLQKVNAVILQKQEKANILTPGAETG